MTSITITLPEDRLQKLKEIALNFGITPEELARVGIEELLSRPEESFQKTVDYVLNKNKKLYE